MSLDGTKIVIVGAGIGGLTAAIALCARGAKVTVLEQAEAISEVGAGIQVGPNGAAVLKALGLGNAFAALATRGGAVELRNYAQGSEVANLDLQRLPPDQPYYFVHRADLITLLADAARESGVKIRLLQKVKSIEASDTPEIHLCNGARVRADIVIGADGLHSRLRPVLNGPEKPFFTKQVAWRATIPNTVDHPNVARVHMGPKRHLVSYPLRNGTMINLVAVQETNDWVDEGWSHKDDPDNLRAAFSDFGGDVPAMLNQVTDVGLWGLFRHPVAAVWHQGHTALIGDAAHPTLPFMAQGAVMAMEDAWVLADSLDHAPTVKGGLATYQARRHDRVRKVVATASGNAWKYHLSFPPLRTAAHLALRLGSRLLPDRMMHQFDWIYLHDVTKSHKTDP